MGWGRTLLLGDIGNRLDIADTEQDIRSLSDQLARKSDVDISQSEAISQLQFENDQLKVYLGSLLRLLVSKGVLSRDELNTFVDVIDGS